MNEVDTDGNVVHLTSLDAPPEVVKLNFSVFILDALDVDFPLLREHLW